MKALALFLFFSLSFAQIAKTVQISSFKEALHKQLLDDMKSSPVDMKKLLADYSWDSNQKEVLLKKLKPFQSRQALKEMKMLDHLGTKKEPIRLKLLIFLIKYEQFQGLFNIQGVFGKSFYVGNDLDGGNYPSKVELVKTSSKPGWQINILQDTK